MALKTRTMLVVGVAVGYVLGARAGRGRYEQIAGAARRVWNTPGIQAPVERAKGIAANSVGALPGILVTGLVKAVAAGVSSPQRKPRAGGASRSGGAGVSRIAGGSGGPGSSGGRGTSGASGAASGVSE